MPKLIAGEWQKAKYSNLPPKHERVDFVLTAPEWWRPGMEKGFIGKDGLTYLDSGELVRGQMRWFRRYTEAADDLTLESNRKGYLSLEQQQDGTVTVSSGGPIGLIAHNLTMEALEATAQWFNKALEASKK